MKQRTKKRRQQKPRAATSRIKKRTTTKTRKIYKEHDFSSGEGMLTSVWGPTLWHYLHTMSFNYPVKPTQEQKKQYMNFIKSLIHVLPCKYCRINLVSNFKQLPLRMQDMKNRETFSKYIYALHEHINKMLHKKPNLTYNDVRERYEHFRARCTLTDKEVIELLRKRNHKRKQSTRKKEKGCTTPLYGKKSKCIIKIVPQETKCETFQIDKKCIKKSITI